MTTGAATQGFTSAGSQIFIANAIPASFNKTGFEVLTFTEIGEVSDIGEFGPEYSVVTFTPVAGRIVRKKKGSVNFGALPLTMAMVPGDAGHVKLLAGLNDDAAQSFKVEYQDGTIEYFTGLVMSYKRAIGSSESMTMASTNIEIDSEIVSDYPT